jgi:hypothetical protein
MITETSEPVETVEENVESTPAEDKHAGLAHLSEEDREAIIALRRENAEKRIKAKEAMTELEALKAEKKALEEAKLLEDGKLKELLESKESELKELSPLKEKVTSYEAYFQGQLEEHLKELPETQRALIESSGFDVAKKLEWCQKLQKEVNGLKPTIDGARPNGSAPDDKIDMKEYIGIEGQRKLVNLSKTNRPLYDAIIKEKQKLF